MATLPDAEVDPEEEEVEDLSIPGPSFMKLMALTAAPVQPGTVLNATAVTRDAEVLFSGRWSWFLNENVDCFSSQLSPCSSPRWRGRK